METEVTDAVARLWAQQEFGRARIGDARRTQRLVDMAAQVALRPAGKLTQVWEEGAEREGAYRLVENQAIEARDMACAAHQAAFARARGEYVCAPVDGTSLSLPAARGKPRGKGFGPVGTAKAKARGLEAINAIVVSDKGVPLGPCGQHLWARGGVRKKPAASRPLEDKETRHGWTSWSRCCERVRRRGTRGGPGFSWTGVEIAATCCTGPS